MSQLHNETPSAQNKRLKAELADERATCATLIEAMTRIVSLQPREVHVGYENSMSSQAYVYEDYVSLAEVRSIVLPVLKQANGKGL